MKEDISPSMLAFDYGKLAIEINVGIVVVYNPKLIDQLQQVWNQTDRRNVTKSM